MSTIRRKHLTAVDELMSLSSVMDLSLLTKFGTREIDDHASMTKQKLCMILIDCLDLYVRTTHWCPVWCNLQQVYVMFSRFAPQAVMSPLWTAMRLSAAM
jgi:hypothetical protein